MLKWTASAHRVAQSQTPQKLLATMQTPRPSERAARKQRRRTIAVNGHNNKENILPVTSTPMVARVARNSPLVLAPLSDILNVTPESPLTANTPDRYRRIISTNISASTISMNSHQTSTASNSTANNNTTLTNRRHSTVGITLPHIPYAATLPRFQEEEYSPSTAILPTGQQLALRGLLPDPFLGNPRYFQSPELTQKQIAAKIEQIQAATAKTLPKKRKLEQEFSALAHDNAGEAETAKRNASGLNSAKMGDHTLDNLIDAILDSARKDEKKKKPRKSFNLRRRTLLKNQVENVNELMLSPSYAAGDDPASDLSFLLAPPTERKKALHAVTPKVTRLPPTPEPATPAPGCAIPDAILRQMPTPTPALATAVAADAAKRTNVDDSTTTFMLETPVRPLAQKRRKKPLNIASPATTPAATLPVSNGPAAATSSEPCNVHKKFKVDTRNYFEIGLALPSIYV